MARFLIATVPQTGHTFPCLPFARKLVERGHEVYWYCGSKFRAKIEETGAKYCPVKSVPDYDEVDLEATFPELKKLKGFALFKAQIRYIFADPVAGQIKDLKNILAEFPADVIIGDSAFSPVPIIGETENRPWAIIGVTPLGLPAPYIAPSGLGLFPSHSFFGRLRNRALYWMVPNLIFRDMFKMVNRLATEIGYKEKITSLDSIFASPYLFLQTTIPQFDYPRPDLPPSVHFVGVSKLEPYPDFQPPAWWDELDSGKPVALVTQGTIATHFEELLVPAIQALANENMLVVATTGGQPIENVKIDALPSNVRMERFIPYYHLLPHVDVMVTNGGYGGVQNALANGVPLVVAGKSEGKVEVCNRVSWAGVGINLKTQTPKPQKILEAVKKVLNEPGYKEKARQIQAEYARHDAPNEAARRLEELAATKKPVYASRQGDLAGKSLS